MKGRGRGGLIEGGGGVGACRLSSSEKGGGGLNRGFTVCDFREPAHHYYLVT